MLDKANKKKKRFSKLRHTNQRPPCSHTWKSHRNPKLKESYNKCAENMVLDHVNPRLAASVYVSSYELYAVDLKAPVLLVSSNLWLLHCFGLLVSSVFRTLKVEI